MRLLTGFATIAFALLAVTSGLAIGAPGEGLLNRLLAPGPLIQGHRDLEGTDCLKCHDAGKGVPDAKCLDCHKEIRPDVQEKRGFHGTAGKNCIACHGDHKGRDFDSTKIDPKKFDHDKTGFKLDGKHENLKCSECHLEKRGSKRTRPGDLKFVGSKSSCVACHKKHDPHKFIAGSEWAKRDCNACHGLKSWKEGVRFNHEKDAGYKLEGDHAKLSCAECHTPKGKPVAYKWPELKQQQCLSCHEDTHGQRLSKKFQGGRCETCHTQTDWKIQKFDHARITKHSLDGGHAKLKCLECHRQTPTALKQGPKAFNWVGQGTSCKSCHQDVHKKNLSPAFQARQCDACHGISSWKIQNFNHVAVTKFALEGAHSKLKCAECHKQASAAQRLGSKHFKWTGLGTSCKDCHQDVHKNNLSPAFQAKQCDSCHGVSSWKIQKFEHEAITRYPLRGAHAELKCADCHKQSSAALKEGVKAFKWAGLPSRSANDCASCHGDFHRFDAFSSSKTPKPKDCLACHTEQKWKQTHDFNHDRDTRYRIDGKHLELSCNECHVGPKGPPAPPPAKKGTYHWDELEKKTCETCHKSPHIGSPNRAFFENKCSQCHTTQGWKTLMKGGAGFDHAKNTRFPLTGKHETAKCDACHTISGKQVWRIEGAEHKFCASCHENVHKEQFSSDFRDRSCSECHTTKDFKVRYKFDHDLSRFKVQDKHASLKCSECHKTTATFLRTKPPVRASQFTFPELGKKSCETCHKDPHRGNFGNSCTECHDERGWKSTRDFHKNFTLTGAHYTLSCGECHKGDRRLAGMSNKCIVCHQKDDVHSGTLPNCGECHRQHFWDVAGFRHSLTMFPLRGTHRTLDCNACHNSSIYRGYKGTPSQCVDCHRSDAQSVSFPVHIMPTMQDCSSCHNQFSF